MCTLYSVNCTLYSFMKNRPVHCAHYESTRYSGMCILYTVHCTVSWTIILSTVPIMNPLLIILCKLYIVQFHEQSSCPLCQLGIHFSGMCTLYTVNCTLYSFMNNRPVHFAQYESTRYSGMCILYTVHCTVSWTIILSTVPIMNPLLRYVHIIHCKLYIVQFHVLSSCSPQRNHYVFFSKSCLSQLKEFQLDLTFLW